MIVHVLLRGLPLCGFTRDVPARWPKGHRWATIQEATDDAYRLPSGARWCSACASSAARREETYTPPFREEECGGAFDGNSVTSDADPGL